MSIRESRKRNDNSIISIDPTTRQNKNMKIQLRLTPSVEQQLRQYAEVRNTSVTEALETIVTQKFYNKKINRQYFNLENQATLLVPTNKAVLSHYAKHEINMVANITETTNETYNISLFDKQAELFTNHPEEFEVVTIHQVNNAYDTYNFNESCYYSTYNLLPDGNKFLNHIGFILLIHEETNEDGLLSKLRLPIFIHTYDGAVKEARIITQPEAVTLAEKYDNREIVEFLENIDDVVKFENIDDLMTVNELLNNSCYELQQEVNTLKNEKLLQQAEADQELQQLIQELQMENEELKDKLNNIDELISKRISDTFKYAMEKVEQDDFIQKQEELMLQQQHNENE